MPPLPIDEPIIIVGSSVSGELAERFEVNASETKEGRRVYRFKHPAEDVKIRYVQILDENGRDIIKYMPVDGKCTIIVHCSAPDDSPDQSV